VFQWFTGDGRAGFSSRISSHHHPPSDASLVHGLEGVVVVTAGHLIFVTNFVTSLRLRFSGMVSPLCKDSDVESLTWGLVCVAAVSGGRVCEAAARRCF
jgi:hypothetical protein